MTTVTLRPASRKRRAPLDRYPHLPVPLSSVTGLPASNAKWKYYNGRLHGNTVIVEDSDHVESLYYMGFFGKCTISKRNPEFINQPSMKFTQASEYLCPVLEKRRFLRRKKWKVMCEKNDENSDDAEESKEKIEDVEEDNDNEKESEDMPDDVEEGEEMPDDVEEGEEMPEDAEESDGKSDIAELIEEKSDDAEDSGNNSDDVLEITVKSDDSDIEEKYNAEEENPEDENAEDEEESENFDDVEESSEESDDQKAILIDDTTSEEENVDVDATFAERRRAVLYDDPYPINEFIHLSLYEAFYLSYALGCLIVEDDAKKKLDILSFWEYCCKLDPLFIPLYVSYHYFRSKGWVVRPGLKLGTDFCLYKEGPPYYHSSYSILILPVSQSLMPDRLFPSHKPAWTTMIGLNRIVEHTVKETLLCYVVRPDEVGVDDLKNPSCVSKFQVQEILLRRWVSSQEREADDD